LNRTRCFATAFMLVMSLSAASAAEPPCFEMYPNGNGPEGAILLNKCTGQSWLLVGVNTGGGSSLGWHPIPIDMSSDDAPKDDDSAKTDSDAARAD
jgi:hypothetical protein